MGASSATLNTLAGDCAYREEPVSMNSMTSLSKRFH